MVDRLSRFRKIDEDDAMWRTLNEFAISLEPLLRVAFLTAIKTLRGQFSLEELVKLFSHTTPTVAANTIVHRFQAGAFDALRDAARQQVLQAAKFERNLAGVAVRLDGLNPRVIDALNQYGGRLISGVTEQTRAAILEHVRLGLEAGTGPRDFARDIRSLIGLTPRQAQAVANFRRLLETGRYDEAMTRELRNHTHDRVLTGEGKLTQAQIDKQVQDYYKRSLIWRSENIARSEGITALATGQRLMWLQATEQGVVDDLVRRWYVAPGERTCDICLKIPGMNPDGVSVLQPFQTPLGPLYNPAVHPQCRCTVFTRPRIRAA